MYRCTHVYVHVRVHVQFDTSVDYGTIMTLYMYTAQIYTCVQLVMS